MKEINKPVVMEMTVKKYVAEDGTEFDTHTACFEYEKTVSQKLISHIPVIESRIPYGEDNYDYIWYFLKVPEDADLLCAYYNILDKYSELEITLDTYPQWVCLQTNEYGTAWFVDTFDGLKDEFSNYIENMEILFLKTK